MRNHFPPFFPFQKVFIALLGNACGTKIYRTRLLLCPFFALFIVHLSSPPRNTGIFIYLYIYFLKIIYVFPVKKDTGSGCEPYFRKKQLLVHVFRRMINDVADRDFGHSSSRTFLLFFF